jgi:hypothetical protein
VFPFVILAEESASKVLAEAAEDFFGNAYRLKRVVQ